MEVSGDLETEQHANFDCCRSDSPTPCSLTRNAVGSLTPESTKVKPAGAATGTMASTSTICLEAASEGEDLAEDSAGEDSAEVSTRTGKVILLVGGVVMDSKSCNWPLPYHIRSLARLVSATRRTCRFGARRCGAPSIHYCELASDLGQLASQDRTRIYLHNQAASREHCYCKRGQSSKGTAEEAEGT